jgi:hypothetical protein
MGAWRVLGVIGCLLAVGTCSRGQDVSLAEVVQPGDCFEVQLGMKLSGEMRIVRGDSTIPLKMEAEGTHALHERILQVSSSTGLPDKCARVYEKAQVKVLVGSDRSEKMLRPERKLIVAQRLRDGLVVYSPAGPLTRLEVDLTSDHFDLQSLTGLLPAKAVKVGDTWKIANLIAQGVCSFEGLTDHTLTGKLEQVKDDVATFSVTGTANGIDQGALVKLTVDARGQFDLKAKRLVGLEWNLKDEHKFGPVSPETTVQTTTTLKRKRIDQPASLSDPALVSVPPEPLPNMVQLEFRDSKGRFDLLYTREWQTVSHGDERLIMRLMDHGDFVAQVTITPWTRAEKGKHMTPGEFKQAMNSTPGWEPEKELQAGEVPSDTPGRWTYRLSELGTLDGVAVLQNFYLVAGPDGEQVVVAFTMTPKQADKLGPRDLSLVGSMDVPGSLKK